VPEKLSREIGKSYVEIRGKKGCGLCRKSSADLKVKRYYIINKSEFELPEVPELLFQESIDKKCLIPDKLVKIRISNQMMHNILAVCFIEIK